MLFNTVGAILLLGPALARSQQISDFHLTPETVESGKTATGYVKLNAPAGTDGRIITLATKQTFVQVPASIMVAAGKSTATFVVNTNAVTQSSEATITATDPSGKSKKADLQVRVPFVLKVSSLNVKPDSLLGGNGATGAIHLNGNAPVGGFTVSLASDQTFVQVPSSVTVSAGTNSVSFAITSSSVSTDSKAIVTATDANANSAKASVRILAPVVVDVVGIGTDPLSIVGGKSTTGGVLLNHRAPVGDFVVSLASDQSFVQVPSTVTVQAGTLLGAFPVTTTAVTTTSTATLTATDTNGKSVTYKLVVKAPFTLKVTRLEIDPSWVLGGKTVKGTVKLNGKAPSEGFVVNLTSDQASVQVPATLTLSAGLDEAHFSVPTTAVTTDVKAKITVTGPNDIGASTVLLVRAPVVVALESFGLPEDGVKGGKSVNGWIHLNAPALAGGFSVNLTSDQSFVSVPATVVVAEGKKDASFSITTTVVSTKSIAKITASANSVSLTKSLIVRP